MTEPLLAALAEWLRSSPHNLVSASERPRAQVHVAEARAIAAALPAAAAEHWLDLGTGGGLPGLVCAALLPEVRWTLLDATAKKVESVRAFAAANDLDNVTVTHGRAETVARDPDLRGRLDGVVARAVGPLVVVAELARGFLRPGGTLVAVKGPRWQDEEPAFLRARAPLALGRPQAHVLASAERPTVLVSIRAAGPPPAPVPRRDGLPRAQPLGDVQRVAPSRRTARHRP